MVPVDQAQKNIFQCLSISPLAIRLVMKALDDPALPWSRAQ